MDEISKYDFENVSIDDITTFADFLSNASTNVAKSSISILPNIIKDFLNIALENKKINIENKQFKEKIDIVNRCLNIQEVNLQNKYMLDLTKIKADTQLKLQEIEIDKEITILQIEKDKNLVLQKISSDEKIKIKELHIKYDIAMRQQENDIYMFKEKLKESSKRFNKHIVMINKTAVEKKNLRMEFDMILNIINRRINNGTVNGYDMEIFKHLTTLKMKSFESNFDITEGLINMFKGG